jgi:hypothetical protein
MMSCLLTEEIEGWIENLPKSCVQEKSQREREREHEEFGPLRKIVVENNA